METYTQEILDSVSNYRDLQDIAKECGANARGSREELIERILAAQAALPVENPPEAPAEEEQPPPINDAEGEQPPTPEPLQEEEQPPVPEPPAPQEVEEVAFGEKRQISAAAKRQAGQMVAGYLSLEGYTKEVEQTLLSALEAGEQPCVVVGSGNAKFELKIFRQPFNRADVSNDIPAKRDGVVMNVSRRLADANLLPFT